MLFRSRQVISIFGSGDALYIDFAVRFLRIFLFMVPLMGVQIISSNYFAATGRAMKGAFLSLSRQVIFLSPLLLIFPLFMGIDGILYAGPVADTIACIVIIIMMAREMKHLRTLSNETPTFAAAPVAVATTASADVVTAEPSASTKTTSVPTTTYVELEQ